jgi:glycerophosphoryl diester phosphodiesterase
MTPSPSDNPRTFPDTDSPGRVIAHRGASRVAPENTLSAFREAARQGARWIEFDVSLLGDGTPVIHHDATLDRCTNRTGPLAGLSAADLAKIDAGGRHGTAFADEPLPTLDQALGLIGGLGLSANLEMKLHDRDPELMARTVAAALGRHPWTQARIVVSSFDLAPLAALRRLMPEQPLAVLYEPAPADWPDVLRRLRARSLHIWHEHLDAGLLARAGAEGFRVRVYTINEPDRMAPFRGAGLTGVITDHPPLFLDDPAWAAWAATAAD